MALPRSAKQIVLELLTVADAHQGSVARFVDAGEILGFDDNAIRVALARLVAAGTLELVSRGEYRLAESTRALTTRVTGWREFEKPLRAWDGGWACIHVGELARSDRAALRRRERALRLHGFRPLARGLEVRPDNLAGGVAALREQVVALGVEPAVQIFRATELDEITEARARGLWDPDRLTRSYLQTRARIERFVVAVDDLAPRAAAREAFLLGSDVLRAITFDPRLPEPLVDVAARRALIDAMRQLDIVGRTRWAQVFGVPYRLAFVANEVRASA